MRVQLRCVHSWMRPGKVDGMHEWQTIRWDDNTGKIILIDQTKLPGKYEEMRCSSVRDLVSAIQCLAVRGAPALGVAGGYGVALAGYTASDKTMKGFAATVRASAEIIRNARPTAVNLGWGVDRVLGSLDQTKSIEEARVLLLEEAKRVASEDIITCKAIGDTGAPLLPDRCTVLTHCNAGALACTAWGTALGVVRTAILQGKDVRVIACETRPLFQGARLTAWELAQDGIDVTVITDSTAAFLMRTGRVDLVLVGADRITRDVVFNKIGTYMHAVCARYHSIPFYVAAPFSTFDRGHSEPDITIEERGREEIAGCGGVKTVPDNAGIENYAFDATPLSLISGIITEKGLLTPPYPSIIQQSRDV
jgi:methylthioribose-1-phosphate isomerase